MARSDELDERAMRPACYDCDLPYGSEAWADISVPDSIWLMISPTSHGGGLLCFNCINKRLAHLKLRNVPFEVRSGPFCYCVRDNSGETTEAMEASNAR